MKDYQKPIANTIQVSSTDIISRSEYEGELDTRPRQRSIEIEVD